mmetsp:Transcript_14832/g.37701  ORF Transcript_14832/g.37701 Transcript_14832/m.37701 type:complete len:89 (+) Transcript_14832:786-1052(+)
MRPSAPDETNCTPRDMKQDFNTEDVCPSKLRKHTQSLVDHSLSVLSPDAVTTTWSTGENATLHTPLECPLSVPTGASDGTLHNLATLS